MHDWLTRRWLNLPPGPIGLPILGNLLSLGERAEITLSKMTNTYGPVITIYMGSKRTIALNTVEAIKEVIVCQSSKM